MSRGINAGNKGQGSNWCSKAKRAWVHARDNHLCVWCGAAIDAHSTKLTIDHIVPRSKGGTNEAQNLVTACMKCNRRRGNVSAYEYLDDDAPSVYELSLRMLAIAMLTPSPASYKRFMRRDMGSAA